MKYEITIRELKEFTPEEKEKSERFNRGPIGYTAERFSRQPFHEVRILHAEVSKEEFEVVKKAIIGVM